MTKCVEQAQEGPEQMAIDATVWAIEQEMPIKTSGFGVSFNDEARAWERMERESVSPLGAVFLQQQPPALRQGDPWNKMGATALKTSGDWAQGFVVGVDWQGSEAKFLTDSDFSKGIRSGMRVREWLNKAGILASKANA